MVKHNCFLLYFLITIVLLSACSSPRRITQTHEEASKIAITSFNDTVRVLNTGDFLRQNRYGSWEMYLRGTPYELGMKNGLLSSDLFNNQRRIFMDKMAEIVPSDRKRKLILKFVKWYSRNLDAYIPPEYLMEMQELSTFLTPDYDMDSYQMLLFMHAAHDIGHALRDLAIVGCSSVASWGNKTEDGKLLIGRNFDFYVGDEFAKTKTISFVRPTDGIPFMSVAWPGMIGVLSGMNLEGLTVTMNAGKSTIPLSAKMPVSILARQILEKASTLQEAIDIAEKSKLFVSESLMIGSAKDKKAILLELSPKKIGIYEVPNEEQLICTNHFQSEEYRLDKRNIKHIEDSHSKYRYDRLQELLSPIDKLNPQKMADVLRNQQGIGGQDIGMGNDKALNHLLAHHAVIFKPEDKMVWVSNAPYQLGAFTAYDLSKIFSDSTNLSNGLDEEAKLIPEDQFLKSEQFKDYQKYRSIKATVEKDIRLHDTLAIDQVDSLTLLNSNLWYPYYLSGKYFFLQKKYKRASADLEKALTLVIPSKHEEEAVRKLRDKSNKKWKK